MASKRAKAQLQPLKFKAIRSTSEAPEMTLTRTEAVAHVWVTAVKVQNAAKVGQIPA
jgi:hypothetical protein